MAALWILRLTADVDSSMAITEYVNKKHKGRPLAI